MLTRKWSCGESGCKTSVKGVTEGLRIMDKKGDESLMYLDPHNVTFFILDLQPWLLDRTVLPR